MLRCHPPVSPHLFVAVTRLPSATSGVTPGFPRAPCGFRCPPLLEGELLSQTLASLLLRVMFSGVSPKTGGRHSKMKLVPANHPHSC